MTVYFQHFGSPKQVIRIGLNSFATDDTSTVACSQLNKRIYCLSQQLDSHSQQTPPWHLSGTFAYQKSKIQSIKTWTSGLRKLSPQQQTQYPEVFTTHCSVTLKTSSGNLKTPVLNFQLTLLRTQKSIIVLEKTLPKRGRRYSI